MNANVNLKRTNAVEADGTGAQAEGPCELEYSKPIVCESNDTPSLRDFD